MTPLVCDDSGSAHINTQHGSDGFQRALWNKQILNEIKCFPMRYFLQASCEVISRCHLVVRETVAHVYTIYKSQRFLLKECWTYLLNKGEKIPSKEKKKRN